MNATQVLLPMLILRVLIPIGILLWCGESERRRQMASLQRASGSL